jgi:hypothetical protein
LYDIDIQTLASNVASLADLKKLSFKRSTFMDKLKSLDKLLMSANVPNLQDLNFNMTNILSMLQAPQDFNVALERLPQLKKLGIAALSQDNEDAKKYRMLIRSVLKCKKLKTLNVSENFLSPACFHVLRDVFLR